MKRLSTKLISSSKITTSSTSISGNFTSQFTTCSSSSSIAKSPIQNLNPCSNSNGLFSKPYTHNYSTHVKITPYNVGITPYNPFEQKIKKKSALIQEAVKAAKAAKSPEEMLEGFKKHMEDKFDKAELGSACLNIGQELKGEDPQKIISFANRALALLDTVKNVYSVAMTLQLLGSTYCSLRKFNDALGFLNRARKILVKLEEDGNYKYGVNALKILHLGVYTELADVEIGMDRIKEAVDYMRKCLEINECLMGVDSVELGNANRDFAQMCVRIKNFKDGLLYCKKALEIHLRLLGENSVEVGLDRRVLGVIYCGMEEHEKALEENELAQRVFKDCGCRSENELAQRVIPYLERAAETVKDSYGCKHFGVGYIYNKLGSAYLELEKPESAAEMFGVAKDILDVSLGPHHNETIHTCQNLSIAYAAMKSYPLAIEFQQKVVDAWEGHGRSAEDKLSEARRLLEQLKASARGVSSKDYPTKALPLLHSSDASRGLEAPEPSSPKQSV